MYKLPFLSALALLALPAAGSAAIVINEINYDPYGGDNSTNAEWVELHNTDSTPVDLSNWTLAAGSFSLFTFPASSTIQGNGFVVVQYGETSRFVTYYKGGVDPSIVYNFALTGTVGSKMGNSGSTLTLKDSGANTVDTVAYQIVAPWPLTTAPRNTKSNGLTLELLDPATDNSDGANWAVSASPSGTPGRWNSSAGLWYTGAGRNIVSPGSSDNVTISISPQSSGTISSVEAFVAKGSGSSSYSPVALTEAGGIYTGSLGLSADKTLVKYYFLITGSQGQQVSYPFLAPLVPESFFVDSAPPAATDIVINEIMVNPKGADNDTNSEFIEWVNQSDNPIDISGYIGGREFTDPYWTIVPEGTVLAPRGQAGSFVVLAGRPSLLPVLDPAVTVVDFAWTPAVSILVNTANTNVFYARPNDFHWNDVWTDLTLTPVSRVTYYLASGGVASNGWPNSVDGKSYELTDPTTDNTVGSNWTNSPGDGGTPGAINTVADVSDWAIY